MNTRSPRIIHGVRGPSGEPGVLLLVPPSEALDWDLRDEVASTARHWMPDRQAWWVAAPYASTAVAIVTRVHGSKLRLEQLGRPHGIGWRLERAGPPKAAARLVRLTAGRARALWRRMFPGRGAGSI